PFAALVPRRHRHAGHAGELLPRFGKTHSRLFGQEAEMVARRPTAEAMIDAAAIIGVKARAFFGMERAAGPHVALAGLRFALVPHDVLAHHLRDRQALSDLVKKAVGKAHQRLGKHSSPSSHQQPAYPQPMPAIRFPLPALILMTTLPAAMIGATLWLVSDLVPACTLSEETRSTAPDGQFDLVTF